MGNVECFGDRDEEYEEIEDGETVILLNGAELPVSEYNKETDENNAIFMFRVGSATLTKRAVSEEKFRSEVETINDDSWVLPQRTKSVVYKDSRQVNLERLKSYFENDDSSSDEDLSDIDEENVEEVKTFDETQTQEKLITSCIDKSNSGNTDTNEIEMKNLVNDDTVKVKKDDSSTSNNDIAMIDNTTSIDDNDNIDSKKRNIPKTTKKNRRKSKEKRASVVAEDLVSPVQNIICEELVRAILDVDTWGTCIADLKQYKSKIYKFAKSTSNNILAYKLVHIVEGNPHDVNEALNNIKKRKSWDSSYKDVTAYEIEGCKSTDVLHSRFKNWLIPSFDFVDFRRTWHDVPLFNETGEEKKVIVVGFVDADGHAKGRAVEPGFNRCHSKRPSGMIFEDWKVKEYPGRQYTRITYFTVNSTTGVPPPAFIADANTVSSCKAFRKGLDSYMKKQNKKLKNCVSLIKVENANKNKENIFINNLELIYVTFIYGRKGGKRFANDLLTLSYADINDLAMVRGSCRAAKDILRLSPLWLYHLKHTLVNPRDLPTDTFSIFLLSSKIFYAINNKIFKRQILHGFNEAALTAAGSDKDRKGVIIWTELIVHPTVEESIAYWLKTLEDILSARASPTLTDIKKMMLVVLSLFHPSLKNGDANNDCVIISQYLIDIISSKNKKLNKVLSAFLLAFFLYPTRMYFRTFHNEVVDLKRKKVSLEALTKNVDDDQYTELLAIMESCSNIQTTGILLPDVESIRKAIGFCYLVSAEEIVTNDKWKIAKLSFSTRKKKLFIKALASLNPLQLYDLFKHPQLWKQTFKSFGLRKILLKRIVAAAQLEKRGKSQSNNNSVGDEKYSTLLLFYFLLVQEKYPTSSDDFKKGNWKKLVVDPLRKLCNNNSMFQMFENQKDSDGVSENKSPWLEPEYVPSLKGKKIIKPIRMTVTNILSKMGNTKAAWTLLIKSSSCTISQIFMNFRNLMLLNFPVDVLREYCETMLRKVVVEMAVTNDFDFLLTLMKLKHLLTSECNSSYVGQIVESIQKSGNNIGNGESYTNNQNDGKNDTKKQPPYCLSDDECFITMPLKLYTDKKGNLYGDAKLKVVSKHFGSISVTQYQSLLTELLESALSNFVSSINVENLQIYPVISLTPELHDNCMRTGQPPVEPSYSAVSMWKNECLCIQQLLQNNKILREGDIKSKNRLPSKIEEKNKTYSSKDDNNTLTGSLESLKKVPPMSLEEDDGLELVIGITWCEKKNGPRVDLDLSAIMYTASWDELYNCSYQNLTRPGAKHSGDITSAPYPRGARESIHFKFNEMAVDKVKYVVFTVHNFCGQAIDECCSDASIFVAHGNKTGTGPGGLDIIVASALKSSSTNSISGVLIIGRDSKVDLDTSKFVHSHLEKNEVRLISVDAAPKKVKSIAANETSNLTRDTVKRNIESGNYVGKPTKLPLTMLAAINAALVSKTVLIEHGKILSGESTETNTLIVKKEEESILEFIERIVDIMNGLPVLAVAPNYTSAFEAFIRGSLISSKTVRRGIILVIGAQSDINMSRDICQAFSTNLLDENKWLVSVANLRTHKASWESQKFAGISSPILTIEDINVGKNVFDYIRSLNP
eukprot:g5078.t1